MGEGGDSHINLQACPNQGSLTEGTVDLLVLTSLNQLLFTLIIVFTFVTKQAIIIKRLTVLSLPVQLVFPGPNLSLIQWLFSCSFEVAGLDLANIFRENLFSLLLKIDQFPLAKIFSFILKWSSLQKGELN